VNDADRLGRDPAMRWIVGDGDDAPIAVNITLLAGHRPTGDEVIERERGTPRTDGLERASRWG